VDDFLNHELNITITVFTGHRDGTATPYVPAPSSPIMTVTGCGRKNPLLASRITAMGLSTMRCDKTKSQFVSCRNVFKWYFGTHKLTDQWVASIRELNLSDSRQDTATPPNTRSTQNTIVGGACYKIADRRIDSWR